MSVELIMSQGSSAGTTAPIQPGYYLVGRHRECQIRPKSRSVSRRHCLLLHNEDGFGALDLKSTRGTYVNGEQIEPHQWRVLKDGDEIRFGKVTFSVSIDASSLFSSDAASESAPVQTAETVTDNSPPESWQNTDIAAFLEEEDRAEYEGRYGITPAVVGNQVEPSEPAVQTLVVDASEDEVQSDLNGEKEIDESVEVDSKPKAVPPRRKIDPKEYKRRSKSKRSISLPSFALPQGDGSHWKLVGTVVLVVLIGGFFVYQVYRFQQPVPVQVRPNLD